MLPVGTILWAKNRPGDHNDHLHVEGIPKKTGTPPLKNPGMTDSVWDIFIALSEMFGEPKYFLDSGTADWSYMGWYNRRKIAGSTTWSQHAWSNAIDIGPYIGVKAQQKFYDFLTGVTPPIPEEDLMLPISPTSEREDIRSLQGRLNTAYGAGLTEDGIFGASTTTAVRTHLGGMTGDPNAQQGKYVVARQWNGLLEQFIRAASPPSGGLNEAQVRQISTDVGRSLFVEKGQPVVIRGT